MLQFLNKPEYVYRPRQGIQRCWQGLRGIRGGCQRLRLPFGVSIKCNTDEDIGRAIATMGIYDLVVSEVVFRLLDPGAVAIDVGANIGQMTLIMALRAGPEGRVVSLEPHPHIFRSLRENLEEWRGDSRLAPIEADEVAASDSNDFGTLRVPRDWNENQGLSSLELATEAGSLFRVRTVRLEDRLNGLAPIGLMKVDVEGHELAVLRGATGLLSRKQVRDIVFEDHSPEASAVRQFLESLGYSVYRLSRSFRGPRLLRPSESLGHPDPPAVQRWNWLATSDTIRAESAINRPGWRALTYYTSAHYNGDTM